MAIFLKKNDTSIWNVYLSDSRKKRTIQNNPARFLLFLLDATSMSGSPPSFSDYLYFYSFMNRKIHAHFHWQPISIVRYCSFSFFREDYAETDIVLFLIFRIGLIKSAVLSSGLSTGHLPIASEGTSYKMAMPVPFKT